jgi:hypothetical protein
MAGFYRRVVHAAMLDRELYEEVEADRRSFGQATLVVVLSGVAAGVMFAPFASWFGLVAGTLTALATWYVWAFLTYLIGTRLLPERKTDADVGQLLRTLGFASAPGLIRVLGVIPFLRIPIFLVSLVWMLAAMVIAVRQALDYRSTFRAFAVCAIGWVGKIILLWILTLLLRL